MTPGPWAFFILTLAAFRLTRLFGWDDFPPIARARAWVTGESCVVTHKSVNSASGLTNEEPDVVWTYRRPLLAHLLQCAFCLGFWTCCFVYLGWLLGGSPGATRWSSPGFYAAVPFAMSAVVGLVAKRLDP